MSLPNLGSFECKRVLGTGGSGMVYEARAIGGPDARWFALKVLREDLVASDKERRRFVEEAERMRRVEHAGLVKVLAAGMLPDGRPFVGMPLLVGETLATRLTRGALPVETAVAHFSALARATQALHDAGIVHRD